MPSVSQHQTPDRALTGDLIGKAHGHNLAHEQLANPIVYAINFRSEWLVAEGARGLVVELMRRGHRSRSGLRERFYNRRSLGSVRANQCNTGSGRRIDFILILNWSLCVLFLENNSKLHLRGKSFALRKGQLDS